MKLTKAEEKLIDRRTKLAEELIIACQAVDELIEAKGCQDDVESYDWLTGCEIYANPSASGKRIKKIIRNK